MQRPIEENMVEYAENMAQEYNRTIRLKSAANKGFYLELPTTSQAGNGEEDLPADFILRQKTKSAVSFVTDELMEMDRSFQNTVSGK